jgi:urease accessory protein
MKTSGKLFLAAIATLALPLLAQAHPGHDGHDLTWSFGTGFGHPLSGWDHLLDMLAVGIWAARLGGRARWLVPAAFVSTMIMGAVFAQSGLALPGIEQGIAASLLILGLFITFAVQLPVTLGMGLVAFFALFHGWAHGAEMPVTNRGFSYGAGFVIATALLHAAGLGLGITLQKQPLLGRLAGGAVATAGVLALVS